MKTVFVNLPFPKRIIRRYTCSYYASNSLFPPIELMSLAAVVRDWKNDEAVIIDAVAERLNLKQMVGRFKVFGSDLIVFMTAIEMLSSDLDCAKEIKEALRIPKSSASGICRRSFPARFLKKPNLSTLLSWANRRCLFQAFMTNLRTTSPLTICRVSP